MGNPSKRTVAGVEVVTIPLADYAKLLDCQRQLAELRAVQNGLNGGFNGHSRSPIDRDPEVATFIANRLGRMTFSDIREACLDRFGADRAPSRSAIHLYSIRVASRLRRTQSHEPPGNPA